MSYNKEKIKNLNITIGDLNLETTRISDYKFIMYLGDTILVDKKTKKRLTNTNQKFLFIPLDRNSKGINKIDHIDYIFALINKYDIYPKEGNISYNQLVKNVQLSYVYAFYDTLLSLGISFIYNFVSDSGENKNSEEKNAIFWRSRKFSMDDLIMSTFGRLLSMENYSISVRVLYIDFIKQIERIKKEKREDIAIDIEAEYATFSHKKDGFLGDEFLLIMKDLNDQTQDRTQIGVKNYR